MPEGNFALPVPKARTRQSWRISFELAFSADTPYGHRFRPLLGDVSYLQSYRVTRHVLPMIVDLAKQSARLRGAQFYMGPGGYQGVLSPSGQLVFRGTRDQAETAMCVIGYLAQQGEVYASTEDPRGDTLTLDVRGFSTFGPVREAKVEARWRRIYAAQHKLAGFLPLTAKEKGMRFLDPTHDWQPSELPVLMASLRAVFRDVRGVKVTKLRTTLATECNQWAKRKNGEEYLDELRRLKRPDVVRAVVAARAKVEPAIKWAYARYLAKAALSKR